MRSFREKDLEREKGIEPSPIAWEAIVLPLNYSRSDANKLENSTALGTRARIGRCDVGRSEPMSILEGRVAKHATVNLGSRFRDFSPNADSE
jgi:hypothetical protein